MEFHRMRHAHTLALLVALGGLAGAQPPQELSATVTLPERSIRAVGKLFAPTQPGIRSVIVSGGSDTTAGTEDARKLWQTGRETGAPWTFAIQPDQQHGQGLNESREFQLAWIDAVMRQRVGERGPFNQVSSGWVGDITTGSITVNPTRTLPPSHMVWLPDEASAKLWRVLTRSRND